MCDWIELSSLLLQVEVSRSDAVDILREEYRYASQDLAAERIESVWTELRRRFRVVGAGCPLTADMASLHPNRAWADVPAYTLCLVLSLGPKYSDWSEHFGADYTEQGELFEQVTVAALRHLMPAWEAVVTGWSRDHAVSLLDVVPVLAASLREEVNRDYGLYTAGKAHESGLDVALFRPFPDGRGATPIYLTQCASGMNWSTKLHTPEIPVWNKIINFVHAPAKAFSIPVALEESEFIKRGVQVNGLLLDRHRLLGLNAVEEDWLPNDLADRIRDWLGSRVDWLVANSDSV